MSERKRYRFVFEIYFRTKCHGCTSLLLSMLIAWTMHLLKTYHLHRGSFPNMHAHPLPSLHHRHTQRCRLLSCKSNHTAPFDAQAFCPGHIPCVLALGKMQPQVSQCHCRACSQIQSHTDNLRSASCNHKTTTSHLAAPAPSELARPGVVGTHGRVQPLYPVQS